MSPFEAKESNNKAIQFNGKPFVVMGMQQLDLFMAKTTAVDWDSKDRVVTQACDRAF